MTSANYHNKFVAVGDDGQRILKERIFLLQFFFKFEILLKNVNGVNVEYWQWSAPQKTVLYNRECISILLNRARFPDFLIYRNFEGSKHVVYRCFSFEISKKKDNFYRKFWIFFVFRNFKILKIVAHNLKNEQ